MTRITVTDRLLSFCQYRARNIAESWYRDVSRNKRTPSFHKLSAEISIHKAELVYRELKDIYSAEAPFQAMESFLNRIHYFDNAVNDGLPQHEVIYALILMRRHIWLYNELQAIIIDVNDMYQGIISFNRILLLFDYMIYIISRDYSEAEPVKDV